ncbi:isoprenyl transferase [Hominifimenecus sp. rT4P-3]|uniref:isoprenyl transferase n=1 Tax=Hominifimenecus sp. rT4P-3 TaxID=3242979 RepID=UPI003DA5CB71
MEDLQVPNHVAIILDGNGRWAKAHGLPRKLGHKAGCENLEQIVEDAARLGIGYLTVYGFSTENWKRSADEVSALMQLFRYYMRKLLKVAMANNVRVKMIGEESRFDSDIIDGIDTLVWETRNNTGMTFVIAVNYGGRDEITRGMRRLAKDAAAGKLDPDAITEETIASYLDTADIPDPDLMIRTSGEQRLSNYLMWQMAYTELYFTDVYWPDFHKEDLIRAIQVYNERDRRFGGR